MSLGSNTGRHRGTVSHNIKQPLPFRPKPRNMTDGGGKMPPASVVVGFLIIIVLIILFRVW